MRSSFGTQILDRLADLGPGNPLRGQPFTTQSRGERQRFELAAQMAEKGNVYILDAPPGPGVGDEDDPLPFDAHPST